jgi:hypothetical protein
VLRWTGKAIDADNLCLMPVSSLSSLSERWGRSPGEPDAVLAKDRSKTKKPDHRPAVRLPDLLQSGRLVTFRSRLL